VKLAKGETITNAQFTVNNGTKNVPSILLKTVPVDKSNIKETVIADGFIKAEQLEFK